jgi:MerR family redox-sensitive transcriptional activator SoxR
MAGVPIGTLARATGLTPSSIRYYESAGLLPKPARQSGQRRYGPEATARLKIIQLARDAGFTIAETRTFLGGGADKRTPAARWRALAQQKLAEIDSLTDRLARMRTLLESSFHCGCLRIEDCERVVLSAAAQRKALKSRPGSPKSS